MFSELEVFADENNPSHADENSNEENDVDDETMSGKFAIMNNLLSISFTLSCIRGYAHVSVDVCISDTSFLTIEELAFGYT